MSELRLELDNLETIEYRLRQAKIARDVAIKSHDQIVDFWQTELAECEAEIDRLKLIGEYVPQHSGEPIDPSVEIKNEA